MAWAWNARRRSGLYCNVQNSVLVFDVFGKLLGKLDLFFCYLRCLDDKVSGEAMIGIGAVHRDCFSLWSLNYYWRGLCTLCNGLPKADSANKHR